MSPSARDLPLQVGLYAASVSLALAMSALLVASTGGSPSRVAGALIDGSVRYPGAWGLTLAVSAPLLVVGLGAVIANKAGLVNIGQEGQVIIGAAAAAAVATRMGGPGGVVLAVALVVGALAGAAWAGIAAALRFGAAVPEVISTLLLVFVAFQVVDFGLTRKALLLDDDPDRVQTLNTGGLLADDVRLPTIEVLGNDLHLGTLVAVVLAVVVSVLLGRTVWGFRLRMLGLNPTTARRAGVSAVLVGGGALLASGAFAGLGGGILLAGGPSYRLTSGFSNSVGWDGLLIALIARNRPGAVVPVALVFGALRTGSGSLAATGVPRNIVDVVQALLVLALLLPPVYLSVRDRRRALAATSARV
jgi:simple sugar transport system permease protein